MLTARKAPPPGRGHSPCIASEACGWDDGAAARLEEQCSEGDERSTASCAGGSRALAVLGAAMHSTSEDCTKGRAAEERPGREARIGRAFGSWLASCCGRSQSGKEGEPGAAQRKEGE